MTQKLDLPEIPAIRSLVQAAGEPQRVADIIGCVLLAIGTGIESWNDNQHGLVQSDTERLTAAVNEAARHFLLLAATHGIK